MSLDEWRLLYGEAPCEHGHAGYCGFCEAARTAKCKHGNAWFCWWCGKVNREEDE